MDLVGFTVYRSLGSSLLRLLVKAVDKIAVAGTRLVELSLGVRRKGGIWCVFKGSEARSCVSCIFLSTMLLYMFYTT